MILYWTIALSTILPSAVASAMVLPMGISITWTVAMTIDIIQADAIKIITLHTYFKRKNAHLQRMWLFMQKEKKY